MKTAYRYRCQNLNALKIMLSLASLSVTSIGSGLRSSAGAGRTTFEGGRRRWDGFGAVFFA